MSEQKKLLTLAEVIDIEPGAKDNPSWINPGFEATVRKIEKKDSNGTPRWQCALGSLTGPYTVSMTVFTAPRFSEGDVIEVTNKLRRTEYNGTAQVTPHKDTIFKVVGRSAHHEEQQEREATSQPATNGQAFPVPGQTVGMSVNNAISLVTAFGLGIGDSKFWPQVHETASDIIRLSRLLESGKLAPSAKDRATPKPTATTPKPPPPAVLKPIQREIEDSDVPF